MAARKLARDLFLSRHLLLPRQVLIPQQVSRPPNAYLFRRNFGVFNEFSEKIKGEVEKNPELQKSFKDLKAKAEELNVVKEDLKMRTKQTTEQLLKQVDGVWTEAEIKAKKV